ncbi:MAG: molybdopterin molybdotransferase MoeA [Planctomycetota bacterium]
MPGRRTESLLPAMATPQNAVAAMLDRLTPLATERCRVDQAAGRVLGEPVLADRDSPAADVSAMDGYAVRHAELAKASAAGDALPLAYEVETGGLPPALPTGHAARIFTGGVVPDGADTVVRREDTAESPESVRWTADAPPRLGANIRRRGENAANGDILVPAGRRIGAAEMAAICSTGVAELSVIRAVRIAIVTTGDEVNPTGQDATGPDASARPLNSNGPMLTALLSQPAWCDVVSTTHARDDADATADAIAHAATIADAVLTTGGVSMGDHDHVPAALLRLGAEVIYHHLAMRPGKPNLGAILPKGVPAVALPGNPLSVAVGAVVLAGPLVRQLAGITHLTRRPVVHTGYTLDAKPARPLKLWHYPLANLDEAGAAIGVPSHGSGDVPSLGRSDGFVELSPGQTLDNIRAPWFGWTIE